MKTAKIIGTILLLIGIYFSYLGVKKVNNNTAEVKALGIELDVSNEKGQNQGMLFLGSGLVMLLAGAYIVVKK